MNVVVVVVVVGGMFFSVVLSLNGPVFVVVVKLESVQGPNGILTP